VIRPRSTTAVSLVASDGGNNGLVFDPFVVQLVRVVDSYGHALFTGAVTVSTDTDALTAAQFDQDTALAHLMTDLGVRHLAELSPMIHTTEEYRTRPGRISPGWVVWFRDLCEWAVLYEQITRKRFATDTLIVRDGLLRSKLFHENLFVRMGERIKDAIGDIARRDRRKVFLVGLAKHSKVIERYRLAMALENSLPTGEPRYLPVSRELERKVYRWDEWARGEDEQGALGEAGKFVLGHLFLARFGRHLSDPIWAVDLLSPHVPEAQEVFGYLFADAQDGFPVPFYPRCLQRAHEHAQVVDFDLTILQDEVLDAIREVIPAGQRDVFETIRFAPDVAGRRYA
jgi:hypothetical protein